jgi:protein-S-isoprenylcysteine O-methyltransferase Ste14
LDSFWWAILAIPACTALIGGIYVLQYRSHPRWRPVFVLLHFLSVVAIISLYGYLCYEQYTPTVWRYPGWAIFAAGSAVFWYAAFRHRASLLVKDDYGVFEGGPYRYVRHPIYAGGLLGAAGLVLVAWSWQVALVWAVLLVSLWALLLLEERELLARLGDTYSAYNSRRRRLIPGIL